MDNKVYKREILDQIIKNDFTSFVHKVFHTLSPGAPYFPNWHIDLIGEYLAATERGEIKRLIINMPPRCLKSVCINVAWPAWILGHRPESRIISASYSQILSTKLSLDTRFILSTDWYKKIFKNTRISNKQNQKTKFMTTKYGFRFSTSVGGTATGEGADYLIVDDPQNPAHIHSENIRSKTINWFLETFSTRLNNRNDGRIILVMQRLHDNDLSGFLEREKSDEWTILKIPLIAQKNIKYSIANFNYEFKKGESINSELFSSKVINSLKNEIGKSGFNAQYLQKPDISFGGIMKKSDIKFAEILPEKFDHIIQSWDTAIKISENSDYSVCSSWGVKDDIYYLISIFEEKLEYPKLKEKILALNEEFLPDIILIEDKASGQSLIQDLRELKHKIIPVKVSRDKVTRFASTLDLFFANRVLFSGNLPNEEKIIEQLTSFPNSKNDDMVDSISQFLNYIKSSRTIRKSYIIREL